MTALTRMPTAAPAMMTPPQDRSAHVGTHYDPNYSTSQMAKGSKSGKRGEPADGAFGDRDGEGGEDSGYDGSKQEFDEVR